MDPDARPDEADAAEAFEREAKAYAAADDAKLFHAHFERPAVTALLPPLAELAVLDAGCGPGWYTQYGLEHGAKVTALDASPKMVAITRARVKNRAEVVEADLRRPLPFSPASFDLVVCSLVLHYLEDWGHVFGEFARVLKPGGLFLLSLPHPFADFQFKLDSYLQPKRLTVEKSVGPVTLVVRPISMLTERLASASFVVERLLEPPPTAQFKRVEPELFERLSKMPAFLLVRARKG